jgi:integrase
MRQSRKSHNIWLKERGHELLPEISPDKFADHLKPMVLLSLNTGLRRGELFALQWENISLSKSTLTVEGGTAKSGKTRHTPLNQEALAVLKKWRPSMDAKGLVFPSSKAGESQFDNVRKAFKGLLDTAKITAFRWHDMRHDFASKLVMASVDLNTVRELLGHASLNMTLRYAHLAPEHKKEAVERLVVANG